MTNGKEIYEAILNVDEKITTIRVDVAEIKAKQEERHKENIGKFDTIFTKLDKIKDVESLRSEVQRLHWIVFVVIILGILLKLT